MAALPQGTLVGHYRIEALVGQGGMGVVYRAVDPALDRPVALKLLAPHLLGDAEAAARFHREATAAAHLKHPNIAAIYEFGQHEGQPFIAAEWIEGQTLTRLLKDQGPLSLDHMLLIFNQLASALDYAHARNIVHRDIKPANILIGPYDHATIVDFGLAWVASAPSVTVTGSIFGTPRYMSPEQVEGKPLDGRADLYALACVTYEMLAGRPPFDDESTPALLHRQLYEPPPPIPELNPTLPPAIQTVLSQALAKKPEGRFPDAKTFGAALHQAAHPAPSSRLRRWGMAAVGLVAVLAICLLSALVATFVANAIPTPTPAPLIVSHIVTSIPGSALPAILTPTDTPMPLPSPSATWSPIPSSTASVAESPTSLVATSTPTPEYHRIVNAHDSLCLSVVTNPESSGSAVVQDTCSGESNQTWEWLPAQGESFQIRLVSSGMCLDIDGNAAENDGLIQRPCDMGQDRQLWQLRSYGESYEIVGAHGGLCVEVPSFQSGRLIQITYYGCNPDKTDNGNQRWQLK